VRAGSEGKLAKGAEAVPGNALDRATFAGQVAPSDTFIQLVGVAHPSPAKARQFQEIDLVSARRAGLSWGVDGAAHQLALVAPGDGQGRVRPIGQMEAVENLHGSLGARDGAVQRQPSAETPYERRKSALMRLISSRSPNGLVR